MSNPKLTQPQQKSSTNLHPVRKKTHRVSQLQKIVQRLWNADGTWVPTIELAQISLLYNSRLHEARHWYDLHIESKTITREDGVKIGFFRMARTPRAQHVLWQMQTGQAVPVKDRKPATKKSPTVEPLTPAVTLPMFGGAR